MIYLHVPFCRSFCTYCDFYSEIACRDRDAQQFQAYADAVCAEAQRRRGEIDATRNLNTLYIGGGTPSVLPLSLLRQMAAQLITGGFIEFTIEVNPEDIVEKGEAYVRGLLEMGVNRISMGVQSLDDGILRWMNRRHSADGARKAYLILGGSTPYEPPRPDCLSDFSPEKSRPGRRSEERMNLPHKGRKHALSIDLITGVPGMTEEILEKTLEEVISWRPEHISAYQLSIEEGSALAKMIEEGRVTELGEEECRAQYELVCRRLAEAGYRHYEISNWALPGHEAVHNSAYWTRHPYAGLGPGAHSLIFYDADLHPRRAKGRFRATEKAARIPALPVRKLPLQRRSWNSQQLSGWTSEGENLSPEEIHEEEVMLLARTALGPIPEKDWFIADDIIPDLL